ncbi:response regulator receiver modulated CheB methylesterase [Gracilibacillus halophilus YIM-C55.5]|uniref:Response regulator receiver modulated CheB methylesterase n=1 Tax=Gracilibacillus halophilus YIM-C55.5 TaxID=1308866 RepID=N4WG11_9BACI|nr:response regulator receiver modulated CheB methylesterase [Gracilibacillus halophilus YIM-C55.5]
MNKHKVLVVDDSAFMRKMISDMINRSNMLEVVDTAKNGRDALEKTHSLQPDVVTLDVEMPIMDGITCLKRIMGEKQPPLLCCPV